MFGLPEIPNWKGIPDAALDAGISFGGATLINKLFGNYWGIFNQYGVPLLLADNVLSLQYQNTSRVVSAPIEKGTFASYNKVADPFKATVQLSKGSGGALERGAFLAQLEILAKSTLKFIVITPEYVYKWANITGYDLVREARDGATLIKVNVHLEEIREVTVKYDEEKVKNPDDAKKKDGGDKTQPTVMGAIEGTLTDLDKIFSDPNKSIIKKGFDGGLAIYNGVEKAFGAVGNIGEETKFMVNQMIGGY